MARGEDRRRRILDFVRIHIRDHGYAPSTREICDAVGISSTSVTNYHVNRLVEAGKLRKAPGTARSLVLVSDSA